MDRLTYPDIARVFGTGLIATGVGLLLFVCITVVWGDPFTAIAERSEQAQLSKQLATLTVSDNSQLANASLDPALTRTAAARWRKQTPLGAPIARLTIPKINLHKVVINGARDQDLSKGPGLYRETPPPGSGQAVAIAGHRTTHGAPFLNIDKLDPGDKIYVTLPYGRFTYTVTRTQIITPSDWSILNVGDEERTSALRAQVKRTGHCIGTCEHLVMTACHPKYSASHRIAVFSKLTAVQLSTSTLQADAA